MTVSGRFLDKERSKDRHSGIFGKLWILPIFRWFCDFFLHFTVFIYSSIAGFLQIFYIFLSKEESYKYNSGRFRKLQKRATTLVFSIFRLFPFIVTWKLIHIQEKPVVNSFSVKFCGFCYFYNFWGPWEYLTYSH